MKNFNLDELSKMDISTLTNKMQKSVTIMKWVGVTIGLIGLVLLFWENWVIAIGVWLLLWGNNLEQKGKKAEAEMKNNDLQKQASQLINNIFSGKGSV